MNDYGYFVRCPMIVVTAAAVVVRSSSGSGGGIRCSRSRGSSRISSSSSRTRQDVSR